MKKFSFVFNQEPFTCELYGQVEIDSDDFVKWFLDNSPVGTRLVAFGKINLDYDFPDFSKSFKRSDFENQIDYSSKKPEEL